jgi:hypothetical protein
MKDKIELCEDCKELKEDGGRHTPPHKNLRETERVEFKSMFGDVPETYYICTVCGKKWLHETGSYGAGWR